MTTRKHPLIVRIVWGLMEAGVKARMAVFVARTCIDDFKASGNLIQTYQYGRSTFTLVRKRR